MLVLINYIKQKVKVYVIYHSEVHLPILVWDYLSRPFLYCNDYTALYYI